MKLDKAEIVAHKNWLAETCKPTMKYRMRENIMIVTKVIGTSTIVRAAASINGWYMAALACFTTIGRCAKRAGISAIDDKAAQSKALAIWVGHRQRRGHNL